jgi:hypothetical protein
MITIKNAGAKIAGAMIAMGLTAGAAFAAIGYTVNVTLPETVSVGGATLPSGTYRVNELPMVGGESTLVFHDSHGAAAATITATRTVSPTTPSANREDESTKTEFVLSQDEDGKARLSRLFIEGERLGFRFDNRR